MSSQITVEKKWWAPPIDGYENQADVGGDREPWLTRGVMEGGGRISGTVYREFMSQVGVQVRAVVYEIPE